ncbi:DNA-binding response regulator [Paenibacillus sp. J31TS4]|uniref:response regulator transcription factor n=1 Tax=Paenibacillus sp. J31TS4 TaxID=2807195 RepID=UPI001B1795ED|nr:response regulator transcription factor [Paenibacillus sp. J31TS4]GIP38834.1 DNA-binding response regulator [Paenibacillus sp. J31TS4]
MKVLVLEDEDAIRGFVRINLKREGLEVIEATTGEEALAVMDSGAAPDIAILDVMLPTISGYDVCREIRSRYPGTGIIMLTAKSQDADKVMGLELGADDYVVKPFSPSELMARIKALSRRMRLHADQPADRLESGPFCLSLTERRMYKHGQEIELTPTEFSIIKLLMENGNKSVSRDEILDQVWGKHYFGDLKIVDVNIRRIRQKLEERPSQPVYIETVWGYGYLWKEEPDREVH